MVSNQNTWNFAQSYVYSYRSLLIVMLAPLLALHRNCARLSQALKGMDLSKMWNAMEILSLQAPKCNVLNYLISAKSSQRRCLPRSSETAPNHKFALPHCTITTSTTKCETHARLGGKIKLNSRQELNLHSFGTSTQRQERQEIK